MDTWLLLARPLAFCMLLATIAGSRAFNGSSVANLPYWMGIGALFLYICYCLFGIGFGNGTSAFAEFTLAGLGAIGALGFGIAAHRGLSPRRLKARPVPAPSPQIPRVGGYYMVFAVVIALAFFSVLTGGQLWRVLTDGVELKWERLNAATEKEAGLLLFDAITLATILVGLAWSIIGHHDDRPSRSRLLLFTVLTLLYVLSTGSRTPLIAVILQVVGAVVYGQRYSRFVRVVSANRLLIAGMGAAVVAFMILVTASRIEVEDLSSSVFEVYFDIRKLGVVGWLTERGAAGFFAATLITYAASTYNNAVIRLQELDAITLSFGYKFAFFYLSALQKMTGGLFEDGIMSWRNLATANNEHLLDIAPSATQWATPFGDAVWDFGVPLTALLTLVVSYVAGTVIRAAALRPSLGNSLLAATIIGFSLSPLVNPLLSLHVHFMFFIVAAIHFTRRRRTRRAARPRGMAPALLSGPHGDTAEPAR